MAIRAAQVNIHPKDVDHVPVMLRHQIRVWGGQVDRFHVTLDVHGSSGGHYGTEGIDTKLAAMRGALAEIGTEFPIVVDEVDMRPETRRAVAAAFFGGGDVPMKAWNGSPLYAYLFGLWKTNADVVVHFDGDMFFGGGSQTWLDEAETMLNDRSDCAFVGPLPGPPREDGRLLGHGEVWSGVEARPIDDEARAYAFDTVSTRIFVTHLDILRRRLGGSLRREGPGLKGQIHARLLGNDPQSRELERLLSGNMAARGLKRVDFLGTEPGMWSLHPPLRNAAFYERLPELVDRAECGDLPEQQLGHYDVVDALIDMSEARRQNRRAVRWKRHARHLARRIGVG